MMIRDQALEKFWLERRLELISKLNDLAHDNFFYGDYGDESRSDESTSEYDDRKNAILQREYADVWTPYNLEQTLKRVHTSSAYGGPQKRTRAKAIVRGKSNKNSKKAK